MDYKDINTNIDWTSTCPPQTCIELERVWDSGQGLFIIFSYCSQDGTNPICFIFCTFSSEVAHRLVLFELQQIKRMLCCTVYDMALCSMSVVTFQWHVTNNYTFSPNTQASNITLRFCLFLVNINRTAPVPEIWFF